MSNLSLERLLFDPDNIAVGPCVGSYIISASDNAIDSTDVGGTEGLNVNILNSLTIDANGIYNVSTNATPDNIGLIGFTRAATPGLAEQVEAITVAIPGIASTPANVHALDTNSFLMGFDTDHWDVINAVSGALSVNFTNTTIAVTASQLDIDDLAYGTDSVTAWQGGTWTVATDFLPNILPLSQAISVTDTAVALPTTPLAGRKRLQIQNLGSEPIEIGKSTVTYGTGLVIPKGATESVEAGPSALYYGIAASGKTVAVRIIES